MSDPTPHNDAPSHPQETSGPPNPPQTSHKAREDLIAWSRANQNAPPHREKLVPSDSSDLSKKPVFHGPIRIISRNGELTELGKKVERERLAKLAAEAEDDDAAGAATGDDGKGKAAEGSCETSSTS